MRQAIVFDFDGTIADTVPLMLDIYHIKAESKGWPVITPTTLNKLKNHTLKYAMKWSGIKFWQIPGLLRQGRKYIGLRADEIKLFKGMDKLIVNLSKNNRLDIYVLSNNSSDTIEIVLNKYGVYNLVNVLPRSSFFGKAKLLNKLIKTNKYFNSDVIMVGDETRDIEAARKVGVNIVAVSWGLQSFDVLEKSGAENICTNVNELTKLLKTKWNLLD
ncbi:hypothetical protein A3F37_03785 [Candidatus Saccharibacteria bacterium RIFCSPHIGHO2_12_FULL_41_12]|nr:MAG: hypothetical protein A3F37_03785 [Candidatus Saccharibacteria bacterium RIFCSPHIGHO2_12_FULL_41_12]